MEEKNQKTGLSRRTFIKGAALGAGAVAVAGISSAKDVYAVPPPKKWDMETDVVVVGFGGAGACAAIAVKDAGSDVIVLEKAPANMPGGNTGCCAGYMLPPSTVEGGIEYYRALGFGTVEDEELIKTFVEAIITVPDWLKSLGVPVELVARNRPGAHPKLPGAKIDYMRVLGGGHVAFEAIMPEVQKRGIKVLNETPVQQLVQDSNTIAVLGVIARDKTKTFSIKARKAVVLACGGYENNPAMQGNFNFPGLKFYPWGTPYNTGDGFWMSSAAGAKLWHIPSLEWMAYGLKAPSEEFGTSIPLWYYPASGGYVFVNKYGKRFADELKHLGHYKGPIESTFFDHRNSEYPNIPFYVVFDEEFRKKGPLAPQQYLPKVTAGWSVVHKVFEGWSQDNSKEIEKGWIIKADTIEELAKKMSIEGKGLATTINSFNEYAAAEKDADFNRGGKTMAALKTPPYYAAELCLTTINTQGGPVHNAKSQVIDVNNKVIPRLYAAGELGSFFGFLYQGGNNFPEALAFGRIAGKNAAEEKPWSKKRE
jgi:succinate dehydrogenase/fumarate reductase flavoprotein subunit